jgi:Arc/MetJ-type ribon-helix-helix transcriptional regulator
MTTRKITLTLPEELVTRAEKAVERGQARSVSAYIAEVAGSGEARTTIDEVVQRWQNEHGSGTAEERADAERRVRALFERADRRLDAHGAA